MVKAQRSLWGINVVAHRSLWGINGVFNVVYGELMV